MEEEEDRRRAEIQWDGGVICITSASRYLDMMFCSSDVFGEFRLCWLQGPRCSSTAEEGTGAR